ncbi:MAG: ABC transporter permease subunit [Clostridiales bacterium]|nr:ABC transporter permease subunit [Clostridiales bacterium]
MKKILSGMLYSLSKGYEIWVLIVLVVIAGAFLDFQNLSSIDSIAIGTFGETADLSAEEQTLIITKDNIDQYRFKESGISAFDVYRFNVDPLPRDVYDKIQKDFFYCPYEEMQGIFNGLNSLHVVAAVLMVVFIPLFFGRMFSQGTIKNLLTCGYSRTKIYLSALLLTVFIDLALFLIRFLGFVLMCVCLKWYPPVYLPVLVPGVLVSLLLLFTTTSLTLAALFITNRKTVAFIIGFLMVISFDFSISKFAHDQLLNYELAMPSAIFYNEEYVKVIQEQGSNVLEERFDYSNFEIEMYYEDQRLVSFGVGDSIPSVVKYSLFALMYSDPTLIQSMQDRFSPYLMTRDGLIYISMGVNVIWIILTNGLGVLFFRKREIRG